jgi:hypothetical protein
MPRTRTRGQRARQARGMNAAKKMQLQFGYNFFNDPDAYPMVRHERMVQGILHVSSEFDAATLAVMRADWFANRDLLLAEFAKSNPTVNFVCFAASCFDQGQAQRDFRQ